MIIQKDLIRITNKGGHKPKQFMIERFNVPEELKGLKIHLNLPEDGVKCVFVYDQVDELRAEYDSVNDKEIVRIYESEEESSLKAVAGPIHQGEWMIALEIDMLEEDKVWEISYYIEGIQKATTFEY